MERNEKNGHVGLTLKKKKKYSSKEEVAEEADESFILFIFIFIFFLSLLSSIYGNRTVRIRLGKKQSALLDEGYA